MNQIKQMPAWIILAVLFVLLMIGYYIRPDNLTEDSAKGVLGALLMSIQHASKAKDDQPTETDK